ncbi:MAG: DUF5625 family protein [Propionivibrio sp.]
MKKGNETKEGGGLLTWIDRFLAIVATAFFPILVSCSITTSPTGVPFLAQKAGSRIEIEYRVTDHRFYSFNLLFLYRKEDSLDRERVRKLVGDSQRNANGELIDPGVSVAVRLKIIEIDGPNPAVLYEAVNSELVSDGHGVGFYSKQIVSVPIKIGRYRIVVENLKDNPELDGVEVIFTIGTNPKVDSIK